MRRFALIAGLLLALPAPAGAATSAVRLTACVKAVAQADRSATFEGDMQRRSGAARMQIRFTLQTRTPDLPRWARVAADGFGTWNSSKTGVRRYVYTKTVRNLPAPGRYRAVVDFRWLDAKGRVIDRARRASAACRQPDPRPDLRAHVFAADPRGIGVSVRNLGAVAAGPFRVTVTIGDGAPRSFMVDGLEGGGRELAIFDEPCSGGVRVEVDDQQAVDERDEGNNVRYAPCPTR